MNLFTPTDSRPVHFVGIGGAGMSALALIACRRGVVGERVRQRSFRRGRHRRHGRRDLAGARPVAPGWRARGGRDRGGVARSSRAGARARAGTARGAAEGGAGRAHRPGPLGGGLRHAREDHHDGHDHGGAHGGGSRAHRHRRRPGERLGRQRPRGGRRPVRGRGRRVRQGVPDAASDRGHREQRRARSPRVLRLDGGARGRVRRVRRPRRDRGRERRRSRRPAGREPARARALPLRLRGRCRRADHRRCAARRPDRRRRSAGAGGARSRSGSRCPACTTCSNAVAALVATEAIGGDVVRAATALAEFGGVGRRFERLGEHGGVAVVDDYAHHPSELVATLAAARQAYPGRRLVAVFQPHLYSRTAAHGQAMGEALAAADLVVVTEVYAAREQPVDGVSGRQVADAARRAGADARFEPTRADVGPPGVRSAHCPATSSSRSAPATSPASAPSSCGGWTRPEARLEAARRPRSRARALVRAAAACCADSTSSG